MVVTNDNIVPSCIAEGCYEDEEQEFRITMTTEMILGLDLTPEGKINIYSTTSGQIVYQEDLLEKLKFYSDKDVEPEERKAMHDLLQKAAVAYL